MYRTVQAAFWTDPDVRPLTPDGKLMKLYLITNPHSHLSGIYYIPPSTIAEETGFKVPHIHTLLRTLLHVKVDPTRMVVFVEKMLHYQARGEKAYRAAANQLTRLHNSPLIKDFIIGYPQVRQYLTKAFLDGVFAPGPLKEEEEEEKKVLSLNSSLSPLNFFLSPEIIQSFWNEMGLAPCKKLGAPLHRKLEVLIKIHQDKEWWFGLFRRVKDSDFLSGRKTDFAATLDWVLGPKNLAKIEQGNYDNRGGSGVDAMKEAFLQS